MDTKINFQKELDKIISEYTESGKKPSLLLHSCCGPCSSYVLEYLNEYFDISVLFYNPNIYPEEEFIHRLNEQSRLISEAYPQIKELIVPEYDHGEFLKAASGYEDEKEGGARCEKCFDLRLKKTREIAKEKGFDLFGTTLTVSPHKNALIINRIGSSYSDEPAPLWLFSDFKKKNGYLRSIELSKEYSLYRQEYCGCEFSLQK